MREAACINNEKQLMLGLRTYADANNGRLPLVNFYQIVNPATGNTAEGSAFFTMLPYYD